MMPPPERFPQTGSRVTTVAACCLLLLAVALVFGRAVTFDFVSLDDDAYIVDERHIQQGVTPAAIRWAFTDLKHGLWIPLVWLSFMVDHLLYGLQPWGWHLTNVGIHAATTIGMFLLLYRQSSSAWRSGFAAALFALHPLRAESVAWVTERKDVLAGLFTITTVAAYAGYVRQPCAGRYAAVLASFGLALASKPTVVPLPFALLLLDLWPLARVPSDPALRPSAIRRLLVEKLPLLTMSLAVSCVTIIGSVRGLAPQTPFDRCARMLNGYAEFAERLVCPLNLAVMAEVSSATSASALGKPWELPLSLALVVAVSIAAWRSRHRQPAFMIGWVWYAVMLLPVSGIVAPGLEPRPDRFTYLPHMGLAVALTWIAADAARSLRVTSSPARDRSLRLGLGLVVMALVAALGWRQVGFWRDSRSLWERTLACDPDNAWAHNSLGIALHASGSLTEAAYHYGRALKVTPDFALARFNIARLHHAAGRLDDARRGYLEAISLDPALGEAHNNLGNVLIQLGRFAEAFGPCTEAERLQPDNPQVQFNLGVAFLRTGAPEKAATRFSQAIRLQPGHAAFHNKLAEALLESGQPAGAKAAAEEAIRLQPLYPAGRLTLGLALAQLGSKEAAIEQLHVARQQALEADKPAVVTEASDALQAIAPKSAD